LRVVLGGGFGHAGLSSVYVLKSDWNWGTLRADARGRRNNISLEAIVTGAGR
jgi:hypothetical protein